MKAVTHSKYGSADVLRLSEVEWPAPKDDEVLVRVHAASINAFDLHLMKGEPLAARLMTGLRKPKAGRPGVDVSGRVESVGQNIEQFRPGDEVFGVCRGSFAEYVCGLESRLAIKPTNVTFQQAAAVPVAAITALQGLRDRAKVQAGQKVLINGAGGGVGTFAVQIAKHFGAEVTAVTRTRKVERIQAIGADRVIDYTRDDFTKTLDRYDVIFDLGVTHRVSDVKRALTKNGCWLFVGGADSRSMMRIFGIVLTALALSPFVSQNFRMVPAKVKKDDLDVLRKLVESGELKPVIDRVYELSDAPNAMRQFASGSLCGKIVLTMPVRL